MSGFDRTFARPPTETNGTLAGPDAVNFWPTPDWFAAELYERKIAPFIRCDSVIVDPTCGDGALLRAIPPIVSAFGIELDRTLAAEAVATTGRKIVVGNALTAPYPQPPTLAFGNPPFSLRFIEALLTRLGDDLPENGRATLILPAYVFQTSRTVERFAQRWSVSVDMIPRDLFHGLSRPLVLADFVRERERKIVGLAFYLETAAFHGFPAEYRRILARSRTNVWVDAILRALQQLGGVGTIDAIARIIVGDRPTATANWRQAIRKWARAAFPCVAPATYALPGTQLAA